MHASDLIVPLIIAVIVGGLTGLVVWKAYDVRNWAGKVRDRYK